MNHVAAVILAGGRGERLSVLAQERAKPAVPFAGKYRIIDFTLSNCANSAIDKLAVLTQYQPLSLIEHIGAGRPWDLDRSGSILRVVQAHLGGRERGWYKGTADAVFQNLGYLEDFGTDLVMILSGDHVYKMDYSELVKDHEEKQADVTIACCTSVPEEELNQFGTVTIDEEGRVLSFEEKVKKPTSNLVSMGVYLFKKEVLQQRLQEDARLRSSSHDFGKDILPRMVRKGTAQMFAYDFQGYWRDVGTVQAYWQSNKDMVEMSPEGFLSDAAWPIRTGELERAPAIVSEKANVINSLVSNGCVIEGDVENSVLSPGVIVSDGAVVKESIIFSDTMVGSHSIVDCSILDKEVVVEAGCHIGYGDDFRPNHKESKVINSGITVVGKKAKIPPGVRIGRNCVIQCGVAESDFLTAEVPSGETINPRT
jgi:glucose-1-phosphate adenylyltransferase